MLSGGASYDKALAEHLITANVGSFSRLSNMVDRGRGLDDLDRVPDLENLLY